VFSGNPVVAEIEEWHAFLRAELARLRENAAGKCAEDCTLCPSSRRNDCQKEVDVYFTELLDAMRQQFMREDGAMRRILAPPAVEDILEQHIEAHADMMGQLLEAIDAPTPHRQVMKSVELVEQWLADHIATQDEPLLVWLKRQPA
jgi:hemerythrin